MHKRLLASNIIMQQPYPCHAKRAQHVSIKKEQ